MNPKMWMETKLIVSQMLLALAPIVAVSVAPSPPWLLFGAMAVLYWLATRYNRASAIEFYDVGEKVGLLTQADELIVLDKNTGERIKNPTIIIYDADTETVRDDCIITFQGREEQE